MEAKKRIVAIIQARMGSSRLPGKVLKEINGQPMLWHVIQRAQQSKRVDVVVVATTVDAGDDAIERFCQENGIGCWRGSVHDVLDRFYQAARAFQADVVVRLTADCPLLDPAVIDLTIQAFEQSGADFAANRLPPPFVRTYPIGLDTEVCSYVALERAWREASAVYEREHVMPYLYDTPGRFKVTVINAEQNHGAQRWTVDTPEDLELVRMIFERLSGQPNFGWRDVLALFEREPQLAQINAGVAHKSYLDVDGRNPQVKG
jgi:spore coat polysaccharide biosynthesis protein SpsF